MKIIFDYRKVRKTGFLMEDIIKKYYYDPKTGFTSANVLYKKLRKDGHTVTLKQVSDFIKKQETAQIHKQAKRKTGRVIDADPYSFQMDLIFFDKFKTINRGFGVFLVLIEITSRKGFIYPLKKKTAEQVREALQTFFEEQKNIKYIYSDNGKEFMNKQVQELIANNIKNTHFVLQDDNHRSLGIINRFIRTMRERIEKWITANKSKNFIDVLDDLVDNYNNTENSTGWTPNEAHPNLDILRQIRIEKSMREAEFFEETIFKVGDTVRLRLRHNLFTKGSKPKFSEEIYTVFEKKGGRYRLLKEDKTVFRRLVLADDLQKIEEVEIKPIRLTRGKTKEKTILRKEDIDRRVRREGV